MTYGYGNPRFHLGAGVSGFDRHYSNLSLDANSDKPRLRWQVGGGPSSKTLGSLSVSYQATDLYLGVDTKRVSLAYSKAWRNVSFRLLAARSSSGGTNTQELLFGIIAPFQSALGDYAVSADQTVREDQSTRTVFINKNAPQGIGMGGSLRATEESSDQTSRRYATEAQFIYKAVRGEGTADYQTREGGYSTSINWSGAIVATHGSLYMSRPISDGFALVTIENLKGVGVLSQSSVAGVTNRHGDAILPDIHSYVDSQVSIDDKDV